jgi:hypothetical protein
MSYMLYMSYMSYMSYCCFKKHLLTLPIAPITLV